MLTKRRTPVPAAPDPAVPHNGSDHDGQGPALGVAQLHQLRGRVGRGEFGGLYRQPFGRDHAAVRVRGGEQLGQRKHAERRDPQVPAVEGEDERWVDGTSPR